MFKNLFSKTKKNNSNNNSIVSISVHKIKPNPNQPRKIFDDNSLQELCESIKNYGLLQPITVREMPGNFFELVSGERRLKACKIIGMKKIPSIIIEITDEQSAALSLIENCNREKLHFFEQAEAYYNFLYRNEISQQELSQKIGINQSTISQKIKLLRLSPIVRNIIINKNLTEDYAIELLKIEDEKLQLKILKSIYENKLTLTRTRDLIEKNINNINSTCENNIMGMCNDSRFFLNTINQAINMMNKSGIVTKSYKKERGDIIEYKIEVVKQR